MRTIPLELKHANTIVNRWHRHHAPAQGHRFSIGCVVDGEIVGALIAGRPVARVLDHHRILEVTRSCTDGTHNANSKLYGAAARAAKAMGYEKIQTYTLPSESGSSLKAVGWEIEDENAGGGQWAHTDGNPRRTDQPTERKIRWARQLCDPLEDHPYHNGHIKRLEGEVPVEPTEAWL